MRSVNNHRAFAGNYSESAVTEALFAPIVDKIEVVRKGSVRRAKLYYLRDRRGRAARIAEEGQGGEGDTAGE